MGKLIGFVLLISSAAVSVGFIRAVVRAYYEYEREVSSYWSLADKSSSLESKAANIDKFVSALEVAHLSGNNAVLFPTPDNSFEQNWAALLSLQSRMHEIETMDVRSFEYQQAISQITAQEQGEAKEMLGVFEGIWYLQHHPLLWDWYGLLVVLGLLVSFFFSFVAISVLGE